MRIGDIITIAQWIYPHSKTKAWSKEKKASDHILLPKHDLQESVSWWGGHWVELMVDNDKWYKMFCIFQVDMDIYCQLAKFLIPFAIPLNQYKWHIDYSKIIHFSNRFTIYWILQVEQFAEDEHLQWKT